MTRRAQYAAPNGLMAEIAIYVCELGHAVAAYIDDQDGTAVQRSYEAGHTETGAKQLARIYHDRLVRNWNMRVLWHSGRREAGTTARAA